MRTSTLDFLEKQIELDEQKRDQWSSLKVAQITRRKAIELNSAWQESRSAHKLNRVCQQIQAQAAALKAEKDKFDDLQEKCDRLKEEMKNKDKKLKEDEEEVKKQDISLKELQTKIDAETLIN